MPQKNSSPRRVITPLLLFTLAGWALWALGRNEPEAPAPSKSGSDRGREPAATPPPTPTRATWSRRRMATTLAFATIFFGGAAFSTAAGDVLVSELEGGTSSATTSTGADPVDEQAQAEEPAADEQPAGDQSAEGDSSAGDESTGGDEQSSGDDQEQAGGDEPVQGDGDQSSSESDAPGDSGGEPSSDDGDGGGDQPSAGADDPSGGGDEGETPLPNVDEGEEGTGSAPATEPLVDGAPSGPTQLDPEANAEGFFATVWLHRTLPDPTPPAKRLSPLFAKTLVREAGRAKLDWALVLGALRARGFTGGSMSTTAVRHAADRLVNLGARRDAWRALLAFHGRTSFADRAMALTRYNRAVGLRALVTGLEAAKPALQQKVLHDSRLHIYPGGRLDVGMGRIDVRVLVLMEYLAEAHGEVTVSSLFSGHRLYARPGVVSAHVYGLAADISALGGTSIAGNQNPNGLTERAVRNILLLPAELQPRQVISLLGLGGPSFPLANHWDHIHVGY